MLALGLALGTALAWGTADFLGGLTTRGLSVLVVMLVSQGFGLVLVAAVTALAGVPAPAAGRLAAGALAGAVLAVGLGALYQGMASGVMSIVSPVSATAAVIPVAYGLARGERPSAVQGAGAALALAGVVVVSRRPRRAVAGAQLATGIGLALVAALGIGLFFVGLDVAAEDGVLWATLMQRVGVVGAVLAVVVAVRPALGATRGRLPALVAIGGLDLAATALFAAATREGLTSLVSVLASLYPVGTVALAYLVVHERLARSQLAGAGTVLAGVALIAAG